MAGPQPRIIFFARILNSGARPKLVVVDYHPECMYEEADHLLAQKQWKALLSLGECLDLALAYRDGDFFARTMLARVIPSVRCQPGIRRSVVCAVQEISNPTPDENAKVARNRIANRGGMILASKPTYAGESNPKAMKYAADPAWLGRDEHAAYIDRFIALAGRHGIPVVWLLPPNVPRAEQERARLGLDRMVQRIHRAVSSAGTQIWSSWIAATRGSITPISWTNFISTGAGRRL